MIVDIFQPVEKALKIHCILHAASSTLWVELPRLRLEFTLQPQSSSLQSRQYPGMSIENNQAFESLIGQHSKIVLVNSRSHDRLVLIPEGRVSYAKNKDHVRVEIGWQCETPRILD
jgi:hypothetical protein